MAARKSNPDDFWRNIVNGITGPFPEVGREPPLTEVAEKKTDLEQRGNFSRVQLNVYFFLNNDTKKYITMQNPTTLTDFGEISLGEAVDLVKRHQKKTKD